MAGWVNGREPFATVVSLDERRGEQEETRKLAGLEMVPEAPEVLTIDGPAREQAEEWITQLYEHIGKVEALLSMLGGFVPERSPASAHVGSMGIKVGELRGQIPVITEAVREMDPGTGGGEAA